MATKYIHTIGRRKTATASLRLFSEKGDSIVNAKPFTTVYTQKADQVKLARVFEQAGLKPEEYHFTAQVRGSGPASQLSAVVHALAKAIAEMNPELRKPLKKAKLFTRDPRMVERKKPGLRKARKAEQYSKR